MSIYTNLVLIALSLIIGQVVCAQEFAGIWNASVQVTEIRKSAGKIDSTTSQLNVGDSRLDKIPYYSPITLLANGEAVLEGAGASLGKRLNTDPVKGVEVRWLIDPRGFLELSIEKSFNLDSTWLIRKVNNSSVDSLCVGIAKDGQFFPQAPPIWECQDSCQTETRIHSGLSREKHNQQIALVEGSLQLKLQYIENISKGVTKFGEPLASEELATLLVKADSTVKVDNINIKWIKGN